VIQELALRWAVTLLFGLSAAGFVFALASGHRHWTRAVGQVLHVVMAVAMAVMAWPKGAELPTTGPMVFFALAAAWFAVIALTRAGEPGHWVINAYDGFMMLAMAWMYAVMNSHLLPGQSSRQHSTAMPEMDMPGTDMSGTSMSDMPGGAIDEGYPAWITGLNLVITIAFACAAVFWVYRYSAERNSAACTDHRVGVACHAMMAGGMAIMFAVML